MFIKYICPNCKEIRYLSSIKKEDVLCKKCGNKMEVSKKNTSVEILSTPEARYLGDEAMYNTIGNRISEKHNRKHTTK